MKATKLILCIIICQLVGFIGSLFTTPAIPAWYDFLNKPFFTPPDWIFGPAWITLYILMAISIWMIWNLGLEKSGVKKALWLFVLQLVLNALWSPLFFGMRSPVAGVIVIIPLWMVLLATIISFYRLSRRAAWLLIPYICWLSYAVVLNISIMILN